MLVEVCKQEAGVSHGETVTHPEGPGKVGMDHFSNTVWTLFLLTVYWLSSNIVFFGIASLVVSLLFFH